MSTCPTCHGSGVVEIIHRYPRTLHLGEVVDEPITAYYACQTCQGKGEVEDEDYSEAAYDETWRWEDEEEAER
jgi:DnaJ-class molecular chaperone